VFGSGQPGGSGILLGSSGSGGLDGSCGRGLIIPTAAPLLKIASGFVAKVRARGALGSTPPRRPPVVIVVVCGAATGLARDDEPDLEEDAELLLALDPLEPELLELEELLDDEELLRELGLELLETPPEEGDGDLDDDRELEVDLELELLLLNDILYLLFRNYQSTD